MKKFPVLAGILLALVIFTNASVWEGAAATAANEDLPQEGYYAATNSFPRDTVVDITNLENGKTIRVIVWGGLDTPGLLIILSKDASKAIGLEARTIGRVRMSQPADSIAFSRFTDGLVNSGDPDYDPRAAVEADNPPAEASVPERPASPAAAERPPAEAPVLERPAAAPSVPPVETTTGVSPVPEEEALPSSTIVDVPESYEPLSPESPVSGTEIAEAAPESPSGTPVGGLPQTEDRSESRPEDAAPVPPQREQESSVPEEAAESSPVLREPAAELAEPVLNLQEPVPEPSPVPGEAAPKPAESVSDLAETAPESGPVSGDIAAESAAEPVRVGEPAAESNPLVSKPPFTETAEVKADPKETGKTEPPDKLAEAIPKAEEPVSDLAWIDRKLNALNLDTDIADSSPGPARKEGGVELSTGAPPVSVKTAPDAGRPASPPAPVKPAPEAARPGPPATPAKPQSGKPVLKEADPDAAWETGGSKEPRSSAPEPRGTDPAREAVIDPASVIEPVKNIKEPPKPAAEPSAEDLRPQVGSVVAKAGEPKPAREPSAEDLRPQVGPVVAKAAEPKSVGEPSAEDLQPQVGPVTAKAAEPKSAGEPSAEDLRPQVGPVTAKAAEPKPAGEPSAEDLQPQVGPVTAKAAEPKPAGEPSAEDLQPQVGPVTAKAGEPKPAREPSVEDLRPQVGPVTAKVAEPKSAGEPSAEDLQPQVGPVTAKAVEPKSAGEPSAEDLRPDVVEAIPALSSSQEPDKIEPLVEPEQPAAEVGQRVVKAESPLPEGKADQGQKASETDAGLQEEPAALEAALETLADILGQNQKEDEAGKTGDKAAGEAPAVKPVPPENRPAAGKQENFPIPTIDKLEKGKYYLQLGAFSKRETVERELLKIDRAYPLIIQGSGAMYRILVGPVNRGESNALLERFKTLGYRDAFVRTGS
ncbi:MAG: SPOR domain-containing protein [Treponema sp.]|jgi:hypothetical protein|nr:SPOR domain-containing protein [Treponema sp.]